MKPLTIALLGNPNSGKTTLFNALTGSEQHVGNWPGVTVERKTGHFDFANTSVKVVDLPGVYSLVQVAADGALDARIACEYILSTDVDLIVNVVDASNLERNLYLTIQLLEMGVPTIVALNMMDVLQQKRCQLDVKALSRSLACPVVPLSAHKGLGITDLQQAICQELPILVQQTVFPEALETVIADLQKGVTGIIADDMECARVLAIRLLEDDRYAAQLVGEEITPLLQQCKSTLEREFDEEADILIADARYSFVHKLTQAALNTTQAVTTSLTAGIDKIVLNRFLGIPIFFAVMYSMFLFAINIAGIFQDFFDIATDTIFVQGLAHLFMQWHLPAWFIAIVAVGVGKGINTTVTFIPVVGGMFLFLSFLESSGYMARAAFVMDRCMRAMGLPGKAFVPMIVGFGCNVPAIMAARTLDNERDRILTIIMSPFMSCSARLAIFAVFAAAFFPVGGQNVVFCLYVIGVAVAVLTGLILRKTLLSGELSPFVLELPPYRMPTMQALWRQTWGRLKRFLSRAGRIIVPVCIVIGALNALTLQGNIALDAAANTSLLSALGKLLTPLFSPMGIHADNWPATVGLLTGMVAKEVVIASLNTLYTQVGHLVNHAQSFDFIAGMKAAFLSIPDNLKALPSALGNPVLASAPDRTINAGVYGVMYQRFAGQAAAFAYLLFVLLYVPCVSTTAVMIKELNKAWATFSVCWSLGLAYGVAVTFYQIATFWQHPLISMCWMLSFSGLFIITLMIMRYYANSNSSEVPHAA